MDGIQDHFLEGMASRKLKICVVDDDSVYRFVTERMLNSIDHEKEIITFKDGEEIMAHLKTHMNDADELPDYLLIDLRMKHMDGLSFLEEYSKLRTELAKKITIYVVSSSVDPTDIEQVHQFDAVNGYLSKPVSGNTLEHLLFMPED